MHYPDVAEANRVVRILDVGMGFGGLTVALAEIFPEKLVLGMEIRAKVCKLWDRDFYNDDKCDCN